MASRVCLSVKSTRFSWVAVLILISLGQASLALAGSDGFLPNNQQLDARVQYYGTSPLVDIFFTSGGVVLDIKDPASLAELEKTLSDGNDEQPLPPRRGQALFLSFDGANSDPQIIPGDENPSRHSFFYGNDPSQWVSDQASFRTLTYGNLWDGVDLVFTLDQGRLSYEIRGDASAAHLRWTGADQIQTTKDGTELVTAYGTFLDSGTGISRTGNPPQDNLVFATRGAGALLWSTLIGGTDDDEGATLAIASNGDVIIAGETRSPDYPGTPGAYEDQYSNYLDVFVSRIADEGSTLVWSTFLGTSNNDYINAIALDANDNPIIGGRSAGSAYPTTPGAFDETYNGGTSDATLSKLSSDGSTLIFGTFVGGSEVDSFFDLMPAANGDLVCVGYTASSNYPVTAGVYQNTFAGPPYDFTVSILSSDGSTLNASTYVGGSNRDACRAVAIDASGDLFLSGFSFSDDFPVTAGTFQTVKSTIDDAALVKMSGDLTTMRWATYLGGDDSERALCVDLDSSGNPVIAGFTYSTDFPTSAGALQESASSSMDGFVAKFNSADGTRDWATYLGGAHVDEIVSVVVDAGDNPVVTGWTTSPNFPVNALGFDDSHNGGEDIFVSRLATDGTSLLWGTFLGDAQNDRGMEVAMDSHDNPVVTGRTASPAFPVSSWAFDTTHNGGNDAVVARFDTGDANLGIAVADALIGCGTSTPVTFSYTPDLPHTPPLRGYSVRIQAPSGLTFNPADITVFSPLSGVNDTFQIVENAPGDCTIDFSFLDQGAGLTEVADLFSIGMSGTDEGLATVNIFSGRFRDENNHPFDVDILATADISVDCTPAAVPTLAAEPLFTAGTSNTVNWSDESTSGAVSYNVQASDQSDFSAITAESGYQAGLSFQFDGLTSGTTYFFRVLSRDENDQDSSYSASESSTQDADLPLSSVSALPAQVGANFSVPYTATDTGSGVASVDLFYNFEGGTFTSVGTFTASPIAFTATDGDGTYGFYTVALDSVGNGEAAPGAADATTTVNTAAPDVPTLAGEPLFTAGLANTVTSSDESASGAVAYNFQISQLADFSVVDSESGSVAGLSYEFTGLTDGLTYFYRVAAIDDLDHASDFSPVVSSTQDASAPVSTVTALANQGTTTFDVPFTATDAGVGVASTELFVNFDGGAFASYGTFGSSPVSYTATQGEGTYGFYTVSIDSLGYQETDPGSAQSSCILDMTPPESQVGALAPYQTSGVFNVNATGSDNLVGIETFELFYSQDSGPWTSAGTTGDGNFTFTAPTDGQFEFYTIATDSVGNVEAAPPGSDTITTVDTDGPTGSFVIDGGAAATNDTTVTLTMTVSGATEMRFSNDNTTFPEGWVPYASSSSWIIGITSGTHTVYGEFRDPAGNLLQTTDTIEVDQVPTAAVGLLAVSPRHQAVSLTWHNPEDSDFDHVEIWRGLLHDGSGLTVYPDYLAGIAPTTPADHQAITNDTDWVLGGTIGQGAAAFIDTVETRGVYFYQVFAVDQAGNFSAPSALTPAATNYILGDMALEFDGLVDVADLTVLGATYGLTDGEVDFNKDADVGPTNNFSGSGLPQPDDYIGFEDLMITGINYGLSAKSGAARPDKADGPVVLSWFRSADRTYTLRLLTDQSGVKGLNLSATLPDGATATVTAGQLCLDQEQPYFLQNVASHGLDAGCAIVGVGQSFQGNGNLLVVNFSQDVVLAPEDLVLILRDSENQDLEFSFEQASAVDVPTHFSLDRNYPNPFNPMTAISFSLPQQTPVLLEIYSVNGRRIATLVNETLDAGQHQVTWTGKNEQGRQVASGVYFYRIAAGDFSDVQKMTLMK